MDKPSTEMRTCRLANVMAAATFCCSFMAPLDSVGRANCARMLCPSEWRSVQKHVRWSLSVLESNEKLSPCAARCGLTVSTICSKSA
jgi:hypothetical protein